MMKIKNKHSFLTMKGAAILVTAVTLVLAGLFVYLSSHGKKAEIQTDMKTPGAANNTSGKVGSTSSDHQESPIDLNILRDQIHGIALVASNASKVKINPLLLQLSGLEENVNRLKSAQESLEASSNIFTTKTVGLDLNKLNAEKTKAATNISKKLSEDRIMLNVKVAYLKDAKKNTDIERVDKLLNEITALLNEARTEIDTLSGIIAAD